MKKHSYLIALAFMLIVTSCKKESEETVPSTNLTPKTSGPSYYPIGTKISASAINLVNRRGEKTSYIGEIPYSPTAFPQVVKGIFTAGKDIALSKNGLYALSYQGDGNLVLYKRAYLGGPNILPALWASNNYAQGGNVNFQGDGNIICKNSTGSIYWVTNKYVSGVNAIWILQDDGNLVGYNGYTLVGGWADTVTITGPPFASTHTDGGKKSTCFGTMCNP